MVIDKKIRERKSLGSFRLDFKWQAEKGKCVLQRVADAEVDCLSVLFGKKVVPFLFEYLRFISDLNIHVTGS